MDKLDVNDERVMEAIQGIIAACGGVPDSFEGELIAQMIETSLKLMTEGHDTGQLKLITRSLKEMRYAYRIFNEYKDARCISMFGSARTPEDHPDYIAAKKFSAGIADKGWMCITGAANGIMKAGLEGSNLKSRFGLSIRLPFEVQPNMVMEGDPKLMVFRYFFTRKLMFLSHSDAVAVFPGGVGTLDELFEVLTLMQTGKASIIPVVLMEGGPGHYWRHWEEYVKQQLLAKGFIDLEDINLYYIAPTIEEGIEHVLQFYRRYHSSRYVQDELVIRLNSPLTDEQVNFLNEKFSKLIEDGKIRLSGPIEGEKDFLELPRLVFQHTRKDVGLLRALIDQVNLF